MINAPVSQTTVDAAAISEGAGNGKLAMAGQTLPKAEQRKLDSGYLKQPLLDELNNELPYFSEDAL